MKHHPKSYSNGLFSFTFPKRFSDIKFYIKGHFFSAVTKILHPSFYPNSIQFIPHSLPTLHVRYKSFSPCASILYYKISMSEELRLGTFKNRHLDRFLLISSIISAVSGKQLRFIQQARYNKKKGRVSIFKVIGIISEYFCY